MYTFFVENIEIEKINIPKNIKFAKISTVPAFSSQILNSQKLIPAKCGKNATRKNKYTQNITPSKLSK